MTSKTPPPAERVRPFADFLIEQSRGQTHAELSEALQTLVAKVKDTGKKGALSLTISITPLKGDSGALNIEDKITLKLPEHDRGGSIFFADNENNLSRSDPNQLEFDSLREVPAPARVDLKNGTGVHTGTGEVTDNTDKTKAGTSA